jgi:hypothetical protein
VAHRFAARRHGVLDLPLMQKNPHLMISRRESIVGLTTLAACSLATRGTAAAATAALLASAPIELNGEWGGSPQPAVLRVITRMREVCLSDIDFISDRQPERLRIEHRKGAQPSIWLHAEPPTTAWIIVSIGDRDWSKLAYQFGHELGHVLCNSWPADARPRLPCQWLEEAMVEAFSIRGLGLLCQSWERNPPFAGDSAFGQAIANYRGNVIANYALGGTTEIGAWFKANRHKLEQINGLATAQGPAIVAIAEALEADRTSVQDLGALNRWPGRSSLPLEKYLELWSASCRQLGSLGRLPALLHKKLALA